MSITNEIKHNAVIGSTDKYGVATWDDTNITWDNALGFWDNKLISASNETKHNAIISNENKS